MPTHVSTLAHQQRSLTTATHYGEPWSPREVELLEEPTTDAELAELLGRSYYAISGARYLLKHGRALGGGNGRSKPRAPRPACACHGLEVLPSGACALD